VTTADVVRPYREGVTWRSRLWAHRDPVLATLCAVGLGAELLVWDGARLAGALPLAPVAGAALYWRRTQPVPAFLTAWLALMSLTRFAPGFDNGSTVFVLIYFISLFSLGAHTRGREISVAVVLVAIGIGVFAYTDSDRLQFGDLVFATLFVGGPWATGLAVRLRSDLARSHAQLRAEQEERRRRAVAEERARIARELHDVVSHAISVTVLQARGARRTLDTDPAAVRQALDAIEQTNAAALGDMRRLLAVLRDTEPEGRDADHHAPQPSLAHLDQLLEQVRRSGVPVEVEVVGTPPEIPPGVDLSAYRIVQEALTNVLKHAADARATIRLEYGDEALTVVVLDDGTPAPTNGESGGHGLIGIRERVSVIGGEVETGPGPDGGFTVRARLPYALELS
jgi:signal transduction histidine kinase